MTRWLILPLLLLTACLSPTRLRFHKIVDREHPYCASGRHLEWDGTIQRCVVFHAADVSAKWLPWSQNGVPMGQWQQVTGNLPEPILKALTYDDVTGVWEIYLSRHWDNRGGSWQNRESLNDGQIITIDTDGRLSLGM